METHSLWDKHWQNKLCWLYWFWQKSLRVKNRLKDLSILKKKSIWNQTARFIFSLKLQTNRKRLWKSLLSSTNKTITFLKTSKKSCKSFSRIRVFVRYELHYRLLFISRNVRNGLILDAHPFGVERKIFSFRVFWKRISIEKSYCINFQEYSKKEK